MARRDFYDDPSAPAPNSLVPAVTGVVTDGDRILLIERLDNERWALPGGAIELGESVPQALVREVREETSLDIEVTGVVGIYSDPRHVIAYDDGEVRQKFAICLAGQLAGLELRHRRHARIKDRIRQAKAAGLRNLPCKDSLENHAWLECVMAAADLVYWSKLLGFADTPAIACCEIDTFRYRILHMAARITRGGRAVTLRLDKTWAWAKTLAPAFDRLCAAFA